MKESERYKALIEMVLTIRPDGCFELLDWLFGKYHTAKILEEEDVKRNVC